jgi:hypothetical protein
MATAAISSTFDITIEGTDLNVSKAFVAPRAFRIVGITAVNIAAGAGTCTVTGATAGVVTAVTNAPPTAGAGVVQAQSVTGPTAPVTVLAANSNILSGESIAVVVSTVTITAVILHCVATSGGQAIAIA